MVFAAGEESRASASKLAATRALSAVEDALTNTVSSVDWMAAMQLRPGQHTTTHFNNPVPVAITVIRLDTTCFFIQAVTPDPSATALNGRIVRRVGLTIEVGSDSAGIFRPLRVPNRGWVELF